MKRILLLLPLLGVLAACDTQEQRMITGTAVGMAAGAAVSSDKDRMKGALIGGALGLAAGTLIGRDPSGRCVYERSDGSRYVGPC
ncbi:MAG: YMGG-like glycine zipper-containing protein [Cypionkella sp.]